MQSRQPLSFAFFSAVLSFYLITGATSAQAAAPAFVGTIAGMTLNEASTANQDVAATDADGEALSFARGNGPGFMQVTTSDDGVVTGTGIGRILLQPSFSQSGTYFGNTVTVTDGNATVTSNTFTITVINVNRPPTITAPLTRSGTVGALILPITATGTDLDLDLLVISQLGKPPGLEFASSTGLGSATYTISGTPQVSDAGSWTINWSVTDGFLIATATTLLTITGPNQNPLIAAPALVTGRICSPVAVTGSASDQDGQNVTLSQANSAPFFAPSSSQGPALNPSIHLEGTPSPSQTGTYTVTWTATDTNSPTPGTATSVTTVQISSNSGNNPPEIGASPDLIKYEGDPIYACELYANASDGDGNIVTITAEGYPSSLMFDPVSSGVGSASANLSGTLGDGDGDADPSVYAITWTATDDGCGALTATATTTLTVRNLGTAPCQGAPAGMVAWWALDDLTGSTANDLASGAHLAALFGTPTHISGATGPGALRLNQDGQYVTADDADELDIGTGSLSLTAWVQMDRNQFPGVPDQQHVLAIKRAPGNPTPAGVSYYFVRLRNDRVEVLLEDTDHRSGLYGFGPVCDLLDGWHHVAVVIGPGGSCSGVPRTLAAYLDGSPLPLISSSGPVPTGDISNGEMLWIGASPNSSSPATPPAFGGDIDEVMMFKRALTEAEVRNIAARDFLASCPVRPTGTPQGVSCPEALPGMVAWWPLDEISGSTVADAAGATLANWPGRTDNGYLQGLPAHITGRVGPGALRFGPGQHVEVADGGDLDIGWGSFSLAAWVQMDPAQYPNGEQHVLAMKRQPGDPAFLTDRTSYLVLLTDGTIRVEVTDKTGAGGSYTFGLTCDLLDGWHHVAVVIARGTSCVGMRSGVRVYLDGVELGLASGSGPVPAGDISNTYPLWIGASPNSPSPPAFGGDIDEVMVFGRALTDAEVATIAAPDYLVDCPARPTETPPGVSCPEALPRMVAWWPFDEMSGPTVADVAGATLANWPDAANTGSFSVLPPTFVTGRTGCGALQLNEGQYVVVGDADQLDIGTGSFSLAAWVKMDPNQFPDGGQHVLAIKREGGTTPAGPYYLLRLVGSEFDVLLSDGSAESNFRFGLTKGLVDDWHHVAVVIARGAPCSGIPTGVTVYLDGDAQPPIAASGPVPMGSISNGYPLWLGASPNSSNPTPPPFGGSIDEVMLFNRALTSSEVRRLNGTAGNPGDFLAMCSARPCIPGNPVVGLDLAAYVGGGRAKPGFDAKYGITYVNHGTEPVEDVLVTLTLADLSVPPHPIAFKPGSPNAGGEAVGGSVTWPSLGRIDPGESRFLTAVAAIPGDVEAGSELKATATIDTRPVSNRDSHPGDNVDTDVNVVVAASDPNEKLVTPQGKIVRTTPLTYQVNFQNVGTAEATTVVVRDDLDAELDLASVQTGAASAPYSFAVDGRTLIWTFTDIQLPPAASDEAGSHGFVKFRVSPEATAPNGALIENRAAIYFDFNDPVITNSVSNTINSPPALQPPTNMFVDEGQVADQALAASDPDLDALTFSLSSGPTYASVTTTGPSAGNLHVAPTSADVGVRAATIKVSDGVLDDSRALLITVRDVATAEAFTTSPNKAIRLQSSRPTWCAEIEPVAGSFQITDVIFSSIALISPGTGSVGRIPAISDKPVIVGDQDGDLVPDFPVCFAKADLRLLFSNVTGTVELPLVIEGDLIGGGKIHATLTVAVHAGGGSLTASVSPNPLNPRATLTFRMSSPGLVRVSLFDLNGRLVRTLMDRTELAAGYHDVLVDGFGNHGERLASGIYFYVVEGRGESARGQITILK